MVNGQLDTVMRHLRRLAAGADDHELTDAQLLQKFVGQRDDAAFAALVRRHQPLVWSVCQHALGHIQDAEDAFQATFLVLLQNADKIRKQDMLGSWLHGVALQVASTLKRAGKRRQRHERKAAHVALEKEDAELSWREVRQVLDEEVGRLAPKYRAPFVLCVLEGLTLAQAARQLGCKEGTVSGRLTDARKLLQKRLTRRGIGLSALLAAVSVAQSAATAAPPAVLTALTIRAAIEFTTRPEAAASLLSARIATLVQGETMLTTKLKWAMALLIAVSSGITSAGLLGRERADARPANTPQTQVVKTAPPKERIRPEDAKNEPAALAISGRVLDPAGKPVAGAKLYLGSHPSHSDDRALPKKVSYPVRATSGAEGKFEFSVATSEWDAGDSDDRRWKVLAVAEGHGCAWAAIGPETKELTLRLVKEAPVGGRILDSDGKPVARAKLTVEGLSDAKGADRAAGWVGSLAGGPAVLSTDKDGRFELTGVGPDRAVTLFLEGPGIATTRLSVSGTTYECRAAVSRPVRGVVRDKDTGKPLAGATVSSAGVTVSWGFPSVEAVTDREGRYELLGLAKARGYQLEATAAERHLYFHLITQQVEDAPGLGATTVNFELVRGRVTVSGMVTDKATGKPVAGAHVNYFALFPNPTAVRMELASMPFTEATTDRDGNYAVAVMAGPGVVGVTASKQDRYMPAWVTTKEFKDFFKTPLSGLGRRQGRFDHC
jgi:RNA polymerase sigma factor (sigma-70 family)